MTKEYVVLSVDAANELYRRIKNGTREEALEYFTLAGERMTVKDNPQMSGPSCGHGLSVSNAFIGGMIGGSAS